MTTTFANLKTEVAQALRDPSNKTFLDADVGDLVNVALAEVGRILPVHFQEDIDPVADTLEYDVQSTVFSGIAPEVEIARVELWDETNTPHTRAMVVPPASAGYAADSQSGWSNWGGKLYIPSFVFNIVDGNEANYSYRLWGYRPYAQMSSDSDVFEGSAVAEAKWAVVQYATLEGLTRLVSERDLFTQWQTRSGNSDVSPAALMNSMNLARDTWRRKSRELYRLRAVV